MSTQRVGYLTGEYPRISDTFIQREVAALRANGTEVQTFAVRRTGHEHLTGPEQRDAQATTTYLLEVAKGPALFMAHGRSLLKQPRRYFRGLSLAWATKRPGIKGAIFQLIYFIEAVVLADQLSKREITHLHNHFGDSSCSVAMLTSEVSGIPFSFTLHGSAIFFEAHSWQLGTKLDRASFCACISHFTRSQGAIFASAETMERLHIVHCGVETGRLTEVAHSGEAKSMIFVGRVVEAKGLGVLFQAMTGLTKKHPDLHLTIVGDGPDRTKLEKAAASHGLGNSVTFVGPKSQAEVAELLGSADLFVLPSYAEGVPVVVMEALGSGVPVVSSFVGGMAEIVEDGVNGFLVAPGNAQQLADRIEQLVTDSELRAAFGKAGRAKVIAEFDSSIEARRLNTLFANSARGVLSETRPNPSAELQAAN